MLSTFSLQASDPVAVSAAAAAALVIAVSVDSGKLITGLKAT